MECFFCKKIIEDSKSNIIKIGDKNPACIQKLLIENVCDGCAMDIANHIRYNKMFYTAKPCYHCNHNTGFADFCQQCNNENKYMFYEKYEGKNGKQNKEIFAK